MQGDASKGRDGNRRIKRDGTQNSRRKALILVLSVDLENPTKIMLNPRCIGSAAGLGGEKVCEPNHQKNRHTHWTGEATTSFGGALKTRRLSDNSPSFSIEL